MSNLGSFGLHNRFDGTPCPKCEVVRCEEPGCGWINPLLYDLTGVDVSPADTDPPTPKPKTPTASGISRLLAAAGFDRAVISITDGKSGFQVTKCNTRADAMKVRQYFLMSGAPENRYGDRLRRYAKAIEAAGYSTEVYAYHLIVTAKED